MDNTLLKKGCTPGWGSMEPGNLRVPVKGVSPNETTTLISVGQKFYQDPVLVLGRGYNSTSPN